MDPRELKRRWGSSITFWGGIDTQRVLPATAAEGARRGAAPDRRDGDRRGYVLAAVHDIQSDVPADNILAMRDAVLDCSGS